MLVEWMNWWIKEALLKEYIYILMQVFLTEVPWMDFKRNLYVSHLKCPHTFPGKRAHNFYQISFSYPLIVKYIMKETLRGS